jgi:putative membrane-bound dehydrogenase-like protein
MTTPLIHRDNASQPVGSDFMRSRSLILLLAFCLFAGRSGVTSEPSKLRVGAYAKNITPTQFPVWVNGGIAAGKAERAVDPLYARSLVLYDGATRLAICVVDNCILPVDLVDRARQLTSEKTGIAPSNILISATHTHSAVSVAGTHGAPVQEDYATALPEWIADGIHEAMKRETDAKLGWGSTIAEKYIHCRHWLMKAGTIQPTPFTGRDFDDVAMNPGHDNPNKIAPMGPIDRVIPILSVQSLDGKPLALLASFSTHYAGSPALSADYFGVVAGKLAKALRNESPESFVGIMANGTSGDANCIDFSQPAKPFTHFDVGNYVAEQILAALPSIEHRTDISLDGILETITLDVRMPTATEVSEAKNYIATHFPDRLPLNIVENYARETVLLSELPPTRPLRCQVLRIGSGVIVANPCESFGETGLKLRRASKFKYTMNIGLANGHAGYIPPPDHFQLGGYTTWRARSSCLEEQAEPKMVDQLTKLLNIIDQKKNASTVSLSPPKRPESPVAPHDSLKFIQTQSDWDVSLAAHEPQVIDPVAMQIDDAGRLWVIEMTDYPNGPREGEHPKGRLVILDDKDGDGRFEHSHVFADKLLFATGLQLWKDGALVTLAGSLVWLRDTDGDSKADKSEPWIEGFQQQNPQLRANDPTLAWDGWIYVANGLRGGTITQPNNTMQGVVMANHDIRIHPLTGQIQLITGPSQFGMTWDQFGNRYHCANRQPCREVLLEPYQLALTSLTALSPSVRDAAPSEAASQVRPLVEAWTTSNLHSGQFTAACGVLVTHSQQFGKQNWGQVLTCEPTGSLVQRRSLQRDYGKTEVADTPPNQEWLASYDPWFRPVNLVEGPEGEIFVLDMYRAVIEHPEWVPAELKQRPDERLGDDKGRIYRMTHRTSPSLGKWDQLRKRPMRSWSSEELIQALGSSSQWERNTALRLLIESEANQNTIEHQLLKESLSSTETSEQAKMNALALLLLRDGADKEVILTTLGNPSSHVRTAVWRLLSDYPRDNIAMAFPGELKKSLGSPNIDEFRAACWALAASAEARDLQASTVSQEYLSTIATKAVAHSDDAVTLTAIAAFARNWPQEWLNQLTTEVAKVHSRNDSDKFITTTGRTALANWVSQAANADSEVTLQAITSVIPVDRWPNLSDNQRSLVMTMWEGFFHGSGRLPESLREPLKSLASSIIANTKQSSAARVSAIRIYRSTFPDQLPAVALKVLSEGEPEVTRAALSTLQGLDSQEISDALLTGLATAPPQLRNDFFQSLRSNPKRLEQLLVSLEQQKISKNVIDATQRQSLTANLDANWIERFKKVLGDAASSDRETVIAEYRKAFALKADPQRGKAVFAQHCAACHRIDQTGTSVGPDISDAREQSFDKMLIAILDPNRAIDGNYFRYIAATDSGSVIEGLLQESTAEHVVLRSQNGITHTLARKEIESFQATGVSLMPVGLEAQIAPEQMVDLLAYIKNWRYLQQGVPALATPQPSP